jgi:hypothetical protein
MGARCPDPKHTAPRSHGPAHTHLQAGHVQGRSGHGHPGQGRLDTNPQAGRVNILAALQRDVEAGQVITLNG